MARKLTRPPAGTLADPGKISENDFMRTIDELATWSGWMVFHPLPAMYADGRWATPTMGAVGYPDLTLVHQRRGLHVVAELKVGKNVLTPGQSAWKAAFTAAGVDFRVWRPISYQTEIVPLLTGAP